MNGLLHFGREYGRHFVFDKSFTDKVTYPVRYKQESTIRLHHEPLCELCAHLREYIRRPIYL